MKLLPSSIRRAVVWLILLCLTAACQAAPAKQQQPSAPAATSTVRLPTATPQITATATRRSSPTARPTSTPAPTLAHGQVQVKAGMAKVPILLYHNIQEKGSSPYIVRPAEFRAQMQALHEAGYQTVTISRLADVLRGGGSLPEKTVVITFDDGYESVYLNAYPILEEFGFQGVVFVIANTLEKDKSYGYLKQSQLRELLRRDWEIGSHSISHHNLKTTPLGLRNEIEGSKQILEEAIGAPVTTFAYPYNISNAWIRERVEEYGYEAAVGVDIFVRQTADRLYFLSRREVQRDTRLTAFLALLEPGAYEAAMLPPPPTATQTTEPALPR